MIIRGDVNLDGRISYDDLFLIQMYILNCITFTDEDSLAAADVNGNGNIDIRDLALVQMHLLGVRILTGVVLENGT